jgi:hypothetical protein
MYAVMNEPNRIEPYRTRQPPSFRPILPLEQGVLRILSLNVSRTSRYSLVILL